MPWLTNAQALRRFTQHTGLRPWRSTWDRWMDRAGLKRLVVNAGVNRKTWIDSDALARWIERCKRGDWQK